MVQWSVVSGEWPVNRHRSSGSTDHWPLPTDHFFRLRLTEKFGRPLDQGGDSAGVGALVDKIPFDELQRRKRLRRDLAQPDAPFRLDLTRHDDAAGGAPRRLNLAGGRQGL